MTLDPEDWTELRALGRQMLDDMFAELEGVRDRPVWRPMPDDIRAGFSGKLPRAPGSAEDAYAEFRRTVMPYATGNTHPLFMGWVHGGGTAPGMLAEMLAGALNANLGGRDHAPIELERQVIRWSAEMFGMPEATSGLLVTGTSMANLIGVLVARTAKLGRDVRRTGLGGARLMAYASKAAHGCIARAMEMAGIGSNQLRLIPHDTNFRMVPLLLSQAIARDRDAGFEPFLVVGTAGTVDTGAIDDLESVGAVARAAGLHFHVDGAFGALAALSPRLRPMLDGIEMADSVAFDFHKWMQAPYDVGCVLVRDPALHLATFDHNATYLRRDERGLARGTVWPCDLGPDLSRGFRALKVWMTLRVYGADRLGEVAEASCDVARHLAAVIDAEPWLERLAPVPLNIVCFRVRGPLGGPGEHGPWEQRASDDLNRDLVADLQEAGLAAPSTTTINGKLAIRTAIVNHRTTIADADHFIAALLNAAQARGVALDGRARDDAKELEHAA